MVGEEGDGGEDERSPEENDPKEGERGCPAEGGGMGMRKAHWS